LIASPTDEASRRPAWLLLAAAVGASLLVVVAANRWTAPSDEHAYWLAARRLIEGQPLYDPSATIVTPYTYLYPPPLAQVLVPVAAIVPSWLFSAGWTALMLVALWWLAGRDLVRTLALVSFIPVAVEFWFRNVHLFLAVLAVVGLRRWSGWLAIGAAIKVSPGLGIPYLALRGEWRRAGIATGVGLVALVISVLLTPGAWAAYLDFVRNTDPFQQTSFVAVSFPVRLALALAMVGIASRLRAPWAELLLVGAMTVALPSLWFTGLSLLVAAVPLWRPVAEAPRA
jgi:hypothetical protein